MKKILIPVIAISIIGIAFLLFYETHEDRIKRTEKSVFHVLGYSKGKLQQTGTGFFIKLSDKSIKGISNLHVVKDADSIVIRTNNGKEFYIEHLSNFSDELDFVSFEFFEELIKYNDLEYLRINNGELNKGDKAFIIGHPEGLDYSYSEGVVSSIRELGDHKVVQTTAPISSGSSGSPLLNMSGKVIGINTFSLVDGQNLNFAYELVDSLLVSNRIVNMGELNLEIDEKDVKYAIKIIKQNIIESGNGTRLRSLLIYGIPESLVNTSNKLVSVFEKYPELVLREIILDNWRGEYVPMPLNIKLDYYYRDKHPFPKEPTTGRYYGNSPEWEEFYRERQSYWDDINQYVKRIEEKYQDDPTTLWKNELVPLNEFGFPVKLEEFIRMNSFVNLPQYINSNFLSKCRYSIFDSLFLINASSKLDTNLYAHLQSDISDEQFLPFFLKKLDESRIELNKNQKYRYWQLNGELDEQNFVDDKYLNFFESINHDEFVDHYHEKITYSKGLYFLARGNLILALQVFGELEKRQSSNENVIAASNVTKLLLNKYYNTNYDLSLEVEKSHHYVTGYVGLTFLLKYAVSGIYDCNFVTNHERVNHYYRDNDAFFLVNDSETSIYSLLFKSVFFSRSRCYGTQRDLNIGFDRSLIN